MPTEFLAAAVTVCTDAGPEAFDFGDQLLSRQHLEVFVHSLPFSRIGRARDVLPRDAPFFRVYCTLMTARIHGWKQH